VKIIKSLLLILLTAVFVTFAVANREFISLSLFPLPYTVEMPKFLLAIVCVALGAIIGWMVLGVRMSKNYFQMKSEHKRVVALQNEVSALHSEKHAHVPALSSEL
jgi:putative membrane protein